MSLGRYAKKRDTAEKSVVDALRKVGAQVLFADDIDLIVLFRGTIFLIEVKTPKIGRVTKTQADLVARGWPVQVVRNEAEALKAIGL